MGNPSVTRRALLATAAGGVVLGAVPEVATAAGEPRIGAIPGQISFEFVGKLLQNGAAFEGFGYLTRIAGVSASALFSSADHSEATAHFTFHAGTTLTGRSHLNNLEILDADGPMVFYHRGVPGASFSDPASFTAGQRVATFATHLQSVVVAQSVDQGSHQLEGLLVQSSAPLWQLNGQERRFGAVGQRQRVTANGWSQRTSSVGPQSQAWVAGLADLVEV
jgi:hypothetical protein